MKKSRALKDVLLTGGGLGLMAGILSIWDETHSFFIAFFEWAIFVALIGAIADTPSLMGFC